MSDEPLYCPACGLEIGPDHVGCLYDGASLPRDIRYCEVCGVVPRLGGECHFYADGGRTQYCEPAPLPDGKE